MEPLVNIVIPTFNRAHLIAKAVEAALGQSYHNFLVTVVDDASTDATKSALTPYFTQPNFLYIQLGNNVGTARAKNVGLALTDAQAYTFHDSDDVPHRDKVLRQARVLANPTIGADPCLNWRSFGREPDTRIDVGCVLTHHDLLLPDGHRVEIRRTLSLVDDFFPNLQMGSMVPGDWTHINSGLFRTSVFEQLGGFADCIEEDREFRNRVVMAGEVVWVLPDILLTKIETPDSLTQSSESNYDSPRRVADREAVWSKVAHWRSTGEVLPDPIHLADVEIAFVSNPMHLGQTSVCMTPETRHWAENILTRHTADPAADAFRRPLHLAHGS